MTIRSVGYDGAIGEIDWSQHLAPLLGRPETVAGTTDFRVTATTGLSVRVAPGVAHGWGVTDVSDAAEDIQLDAVTTGVRHDTIVLRRNWAGSSTTPTGIATGGRTSVGVQKGGASATIATLTRNGGVLAEQPLALVRVAAGATTVQVVEDLRATHATAAYVRSMLAMTGPPGTRYTLEPDGRRYVTRATTSGGVEAQEEWQPPPPTIPSITPVASGTAAVTFNNGVAVIRHTLGRRPKTVLLASRASTSSGFIDVALSVQAGSANETSFTVVAKVISGSSPSGWNPYTGNLTYLDWIAIG